MSKLPSKNGVMSRGSSSRRRVKLRKITIQQPKINDESLLRHSVTARLSTGAAGFALLMVPQFAYATDKTFDVAAEFQEQLQTIVTTGSGASSLTYSGDSSSLVLTEDVTTPGSNESLTINLGQGSVLLQGAALTLSGGTVMSTAVTGKTGDVYVGYDGQAGTLNVDGGVLNISQALGTNALAIGYTGNTTGTVNITNGGVVNMGAGETTSNYAQLFVGYGGASQINMDNGSINFGPKGASIRVGLGHESTLNMSNGSIIDSSQGASHFWLGEWYNNKVTANVDNSSIIIKGGGTNSAADERAFVIGYAGGSGEFNQSGADSYVHVSGIYRIGIASGNGANGVYNLNGGLLEVGREGIKDSFRIGVDVYDSKNAATAVFNVNDGRAKIHGNLEIGSSGSSGNRPDATVNINGGVIDVGQKVNFGVNNGKLNLNGGYLQLGGDNAITGSGTMTFDGGAIRATSDLTINHAATVNGKGAILDSGAHVLTFAGVLSGTGGVKKTGAGTVHLTGANSFSGGILVENGTLGANTQAGLGTGAITLNAGELLLPSSGTFINDVVIGSNGGTLNFGAATTAGAFNGSGSGNVTLQNGRLNLASNSTSWSWSGKTILADGFTLIAEDDNVLSAASLLSMGEEATLEVLADQTIGGLEGEGEILLAAAGEALTLDHGAVDGSYQGLLSGIGDFVKKGSGKFTFAPTTHSHSGALVVDGGELVLNTVMLGTSVQLEGESRLSGGGVIKSLSKGATAGGTVAPGSSTTTLTYVERLDLDGLTYEVAIDGDGNSGMLAGEAGSTANLTNGTLSVLAGSGTLTEGTKYTVLTADSYTGLFETVTDNFAFLKAVANYDEPTQVSVVLNQDTNAFVDLARTDNQRAVGVALTSLGEDDPLMAALLQVTEDEAEATYDALSGQSHASAHQTLLEDVGHARNILGNRLRSGAGGPQKLSFLPQAREVSSWATGYGSASRIDATSNTAEVKGSSGGLFVGLEAENDMTIAGVFGGFSEASHKATALGASGKARTLQFGVYAGQKLNAVRLRGGLSYARSKNTSSREISVGGVAETLEAGYDSTALQVFGELGYNVALENGSIEPFLSFAHVHTKTDGYSETGGAAALSVEKASRNASFVTLGVHGARDFLLSGKNVEAVGTIGWQHALGDLSATSTNRFASGDAFRVTGASNSRGSVVIQGGVQVSLSERTRLQLSYDGNFNSSGTAHRGAVSLNMRF